MIWNLYDSGSTDVLETVVSLLKLLYKLADRGRRPPVVTPVVKAGLPQIKKENSSRSIRKS